MRYGKEYKRELRCIERLALGRRRKLPSSPSSPVMSFGDIGVIVGNVMLTQYLAQIRINEAFDDPRFM